MRYFSTDTLIQFLFVVPCVLIALTFHEFAHGYMAYKLGDPTAKKLRTADAQSAEAPRPHRNNMHDILPLRLGKTCSDKLALLQKPEADMALTAAAGPIMNFILALFGVLVCRILTKIFVAFPAQSDFVYYIQYAALTLFSYFHMLNLSLGVFNLIPIPPLDGSRIFYIFLPPKWYFGVMKYEKYIQLALLVLLWTGLLSRPLSAAVSWISGGMQWLVSWI